MSQVELGNSQPRVFFYTAGCLADKSSILTTNWLQARLCASVFRNLLNLCGNMLWRELVVINPPCSFIICSPAAERVQSEQSANWYQTWNVRLFFLINTGGFQPSDGFQCSAVSTDWFGTGWRSHQPWSRLESRDQGWLLDPECLRVFPEMSSHCSCWWTCWWRNQQVFIISSCRTVTTDTKIFWRVENYRRIYALKSGMQPEQGLRSDGNCGKSRKRH